MVHVRTDGEGTARGCEPPELLADGGSIAVTADTPIALTPAGPFQPLAIALERDAPLADVMAKTITIPSLAAWLRLRRVVLVLSAAPLLMLLELDRELVGGGLLGLGRAMIDGLLAVYVGIELTRRSPRMPMVAGTAMLALAMRWLLVATRLCGKGVHPAVWAAAALSIGAGVAIFTKAPSRSRVALELLDKLGIRRSEANAARARHEVRPSGMRVGLAALGAVGLPLLLWALRRAGAGVWLQASAFVAYGAIVPEVVLRASRPGEKEMASRGGSAAPPPLNVAATLFASVMGLALTASLLYGAHQFFDAGAELARCTDRLESGARRLLDAEASELARRVASVRSSLALALMTTAVMPLAEERVYRGLLMNVLVKRYGFTYGLFVSAAVFGFAHVGVYELALYQTVLLGVGFGLAYAEGGIVAAFIVHAVWNLLNVT